MLMYVLIGLCLVLLGITGLQFTYLAYVDRINAERRKYLRALELKYSAMAARLTEAELRLAEQDEILEGIYPGSSQESWAEIIEDR